MEEDEQQLHEVDVRTEHLCAAEHKDILPDDESDKRHQQIGDRSCQCGQRHAAARLFEVARVDRHGLCPAEAEEQHAERADRVQMLERVQRQPPERFCRRVAELICRVAVRDLVYGQ